MCPCAAGVVNAIGHDYIGVLVLGIFNAVLGRAQIPAHIQCRPLVRTMLHSIQITAGSTWSPAHSHDLESSLLCAHSMFVVTTSNAYQSTIIKCYL